MSRIWIYRLAILINVSGLMLNIRQDGLLVWNNLLLTSNLAVLMVWQKQISRMLLGFLSSAGESKVASTIEETISQNLAKARGFASEMQVAISNINEIGRPEFSVAIQAIQNENIRASLLSANEKIIGLRKKENEHNWVTEGVAAVVSLKHKGNDMADYCLQVISAVVKYLSANQGGFFLLTGDGNDEYFELVATYAYGKEKFTEKRIHLGEGLIGEAYYEKEIICLTDIPKDYVKITSGLGEALPRCVCIVPLLSEGHLYGVIEIASFKPFAPVEIEYLKKIAESVGYHLGSMENHRHTEMLLKESQQMAQEVKSQEEELRQNMEELTATQEQMRRKEKELDAVMASLSTVEIDLQGVILEANPIFLSITGYAAEDIQRKPYKSLIPQHGNDQSQYEIMWNSILAGRSFSGEFRIINKSQKELWMAGNFTPLLNDSGKPYKVMVISLFTTQDKEKLLELNETVTAMKNCFPMAEVNPDMTFRSANDLFLRELGIKRIDLKKSLPKDVLSNGSFNKVEKYFIGDIDQPNNVELNIQDKNGAQKRFSSTLIKINTNSQKKKGLLILRNAL